MKIAISARMLKAVPDDGISRFTFEVIKRLLKDHARHEYILFFDARPDSRLDLIKNAEYQTILPASRHPFQWYVWHEWQLPHALKKSKADIFFSPDGIISLKSEIPSVPVIHDINFLHRPNDIPLVTCLYYNHFFRKFAERAKRIITVSEFCRDDIAANLHISKENIDVAYNGVSDYFAPSTRESADKLRLELTGGVPFFLFVGNFSPRKNIPVLIDAYNLFRNKTGFGHKLILTGGRLYLNRETDKLLNSSPFRNDIILTGSLRHEELGILYSASASLVFVPWFEGFGIPAAEAMRCGTPVILSNTTSLPEVGGDAAIYVDPGNPSEISDAMARIAGDEKLRSELSVSGPLHSQKFTWEKTAESVIKSIEKAAGI